MRVVHFSDSFYPQVNGVVTHVMNAASQLNKMGHEVMIVAPKPADKNISEREVEEMLGKGVRVLFRSSIPAPVYPRFRLGAPNPAIAKEVRKFKPDLIHFHTTLTLGLEAVLTARALKLPLVGTFHTYFMEPESMKVIGFKAHNRISNLLTKILWAFAYKFYGKCGLVVCPTKFVADDLKKRWRDVETRVVPGGIDVESFADVSNRDKLRKKYGLDEKFVFLSLGRLSYEKSLEVLIEAFAQIALKNEKARLVFVGDGPAKKSLLFYCRELGLKDRVLFLGEVKYTKVVKDNYYGLGDVFVTASTFETQGLTINEAMAAGLPVLGVKARATPDLIRRCGLVSAVDNPTAMAKNMQKLISNEKLRRKLAVCATEDAKQFSIESSGLKLVEVYKELFDK